MICVDLRVKYVRMGPLVSHIRVTRRASVAVAERVTRPPRRAGIALRAGNLALRARNLVLESNKRVREKYIQRSVRKTLPYSQRVVAVGLPPSHFGWEFVRGGP